MDFLVAKDDLHRCRFHKGAPAELAAGQVELVVDEFGLTSNNVTYAVFGQAMSYWEFFPAEAGWGRVPVWGFAEVSASRLPELEVGTRMYGYLPPSTSLRVTPTRVDERGFIDATAHRAALPAAYNSYARVDSDPAYDPHHEDQQALLRPLFFTSYLIDDFLADSGLLSAGAVVVSSASSKTASALAFLLSRRDGVEVLGLSSERGAAFARELGVYDLVVSYREIDTLADEPAVYVDIAGDAAVRGAVHDHYREKLLHSAVVGATHYEQMGEVPDSLPGPRPRFFFAPDRVAVRTDDWGRDGLERRLAEAWRPYVKWTGLWLEVKHARGPEAVERVYLDLLDGRIDPAEAHMLSLAR